MQRLRSGSPGHAASTGVISGACASCHALQQNSAEMKQRKLSHALWFQLIKKNKAGGGRILLFVSSLLPLAISFSNHNFKSAFRCKIDLRINVLKKDYFFFSLR